MKQKTADRIGIVFVAVVVIGLVIGWVLNVVKTLDCDFASPYKCEAIRIVGIFFPPIGAIVGWIEIDD